MSFHNVGVPSFEGVENPRVADKQELKDCPFLGLPFSNPREHLLSVSAPVLAPKSSSMEGFLVEGLTPRKMDKVYLLLESMKVKLVKGSEKGFLMEASCDRLSVKVYGRKKKKSSSRALGDS